MTAIFQLPRKTAWLLAVPALLAGCSRVYEVSVDAIHDPTESGVYSYRIAPMGDPDAEKDVNYTRAERLVKTALSSKGMYEAENPEDAEVIVEIEYGIGLPRTEYRTVDRSMERNIMLDSTARSNVAPLGSGIVVDDGKRLEPEQVYDKYLSIVARKAPSEETDQMEGPEVWRVDVTTEDRKEGMAHVLPVLVGAATDFIDSDTEKGRTFIITENAEVVDFVKSDP